MVEQWNSVRGTVEQGLWNNVMEQCWWNSGAVEQWKWNNVVEQGNSDGGTVWWNTVVEQWNSVGEIVEQ